MGECGGVPWYAVAGLAGVGVRASVPFYALDWWAGVGVGGGVSCYVLDGGGVWAGRAMLLRGLGARRRVLFVVCARARLRRAREATMLLFLVRLTQLIRGCLDLNVT